VWAISGNERLGTAVASALGSAFAMFLMGAGAISILLLGSLGGFWLVLIGWFLMRASRGTLLQEVLEERLGRVTAREAMADHCPRVAGDETVEELIAGPILQQGLRHFCVEEHDELTGLITLNEVKSVAAEERATTRIASVMVPRTQLATIEADDSLWNALRRMDDLRVNQLPVVSAGRLIGLLTREQLVRVIRNQMDIGQDR